MTWGLSEVTVVFGNQKALDSVDLTVEPGQLTVVVGGDGAGKTTLTRALVGLATAVSGTVKRPAACGYQPSTSGTWRDLTVLENLHFVARAFGIEVTHRDRRVDQLLTMTNLGTARDRPSGQLSGGMRQKLGVAMALLPEPDLLVLDEPTTGVDPVSRLEIWAFILSAASTGCAVLSTTTYMDEAARAARVLALDQGQTLASGSPQEVRDSLGGAMFASSTPQGAHTWRRGKSWRVWSPDGSTPPDSTPVETDLNDVITVTALEREARV